MTEQPLIATVSIQELFLRGLTDEEKAYAEKLTLKELVEFHSQRAKRNKEQAEKTCE